MSARLELGISPCPNDTFAFHALLAGKIDTRGLELGIEFDDIERLNARLLAGELDAAKGSFATALRANGELAVLASGAALGFGVGPLLLAARGRTHPREPIPGGKRGSREPLVLCPGEHTTASLLYRLFHAGEGRVEQVAFSAILPALARGEADFGVCIHEGRFTWPRYGLGLVEDLGRTWEERTGCALPLGGILVRRSLGEERARALALAVRDSIEHAFAHRDEALATMRAHAQELDDEVLWKHVELYVNEETRELSDDGRKALAALAELARSAGLIATSDSELRIVGSEPEGR